MLNQKLVPQVQCAENLDASSRSGQLVTSPPTSLSPAKNCRKNRWLTSSSNFIHFEWILCILIGYVLAFNCKTTVSISILSSPSQISRPCRPPKNRITTKALSCDLKILVIIGNCIRLVMVNFKKSMELLISVNLLFIRLGKNYL